MLYSPFVRRKELGRYEIRKGALDERLGCALEI